MRFMSGYRTTSDSDEAPRAMLHVERVSLGHLRGLTAEKHEGERESKTHLYQLSWVRTARPRLS